MASEPAIVARGLCRAFGETRAVDHVDLCVRQGEIYGFLGPNGAGKSTTVRMLCALLVPTAGTARVAGHDVATEAGAVRSRIGVALQDAALDDNQTGRELLHLQARLFGLTQTEAERRLEQLGGLIDLGPALDHRIATYSGGMKRRVDVAAALIHNPEILFLDEPTTGLDPVSRARVWAEVRRLNREEGVTIFLTTQYLEEADELADRVGIIDGGRIVAEGSPQELKQSLGSDVIVVRVDGDPDAARQAVQNLDEVEAVTTHGTELTLRVCRGETAIGPVAVALHRCDVTVRGITLRTPTLDDVFLHLTGAHLEAEPVR